MNTHFSQTNFAHVYWALFLKPGCRVVDATCGNGKDSLALAQLVLTKQEGILYCIDIQERALKNTKELLEHHLSNELASRIEYHHSSHTTLYSFSSLDGVIFNLGYLPGGDHEITTQVTTTLESIQYAMERLNKGGILSVMAYPGHEEGKKETLRLKEWVPQLPSQLWEYWIHEKVNATHSPILFILRKRAV